MTTLPTPFENFYRPLVDNYPAFAECLLSPPRISFRVNTLKDSVDNVITRLADIGISATPVSWCEIAFTTTDDTITRTIERFIGTIYMQELASMLPPLIVQDRLVASSKVLDTCAAPGSKTTQAAAIMRNRGLIVANDFRFQRVKALKFNLNKTGVINTFITNYDLHAFPESGFDVIFLDAPCSADGTIRKNPALLETWTPERARSFASVQRGFIIRAFDLLADNGTLMYSTCSMSPEENELVVEHVLSTRDSARLDSITLPGFTFAPALTSWQDRLLHPDLSKAVRVWPHHNNTDGFFLARITKC